MSKENTTGARDFFGEYFLDDSKMLSPEEASKIVIPPEVRQKAKKHEEELYSMLLKEYND